MKIPPNKMALHPAPKQYTKIEKKKTQLKHTLKLLSSSSEPLHTQMMMLRWGTSSLNKE